MMHFSPFPQTPKKTRGSSPIYIDNILGTIMSRLLQLLIIDFSVSLRVDTEESCVEGYCGTKGWAAPELQDDKLSTSPFGRTVWSAGRVLQYIAHFQHADTNSPLPFQYKTLATKLLHLNPPGRPLLSNIDLYHENSRILPLKRKRDVDKEDKNDIERRW